MAAATVTSKGQITLPKSVRERLGVGTGDRVEFVPTGDSFLLRPALTDLRYLKGLLRRRSRPVSIDDMNRAIARMGRKGDPAARS